jgi:hypothetical protein
VADLAGALRAVALTVVLVPDEAAATFLTVVLGFGPVRAAGLVGAFLAAAIGMFLLANDCGRLRVETARIRLGHRKS